MSYRTRIRGQQALSRRLRKLPEAAQREVKDALADSARAVQRDAVAMVPVDTGNLRKVLAGPQAIRIRRKGLRVVFGVTGKKASRDAFYARFVEFGTKGYKAGQKRRSGSTGGRVKYQRVGRTVPARPAQPFMRPAFRKNLPVIRQKVRTAVNRAMKHSKR